MIYSVAGCAQISWTSCNTGRCFDSTVPRTKMHDENKVNEAESSLRTNLMMAMRDKRKWMKTTLTNKPR